jgi:hypothetical protein
MLRTARAVYHRQQEGQEWVYLPDIPQHSRDFATLAYFGFAEQKPGKRKDGGAPGWWRLTDRGVRFMRGGLVERKYALVYDGRCLRLDGELIYVRDIAPEFRLDELMVGV